MINHKSKNLRSLIENDIVGHIKNRSLLRITASTPLPQSRRSGFARAPSRSQFGDSFLRELRLALVSRLGSSESWLRRPVFEAYYKIARGLLMRHLIVVLGLILHE